MSKATRSRSEQLRRGRKKRRLYSDPSPPGRRTRTKDQSSLTKKGERWVGKHAPPHALSTPQQQPKHTRVHWDHLLLTCVT